MKKFTQMPDSPLLNTINSIVIFSYPYFNIWITAPGYPSNTLIFMLLLSRNYVFRVDPSISD